MTARFNDSEVLKATGAAKTRAGTALSFEGVCTDTRQLTLGCLFVALQGDVLLAVFTALPMAA